MRSYKRRGIRSSSESKGHSLSQRMPLEQLENRLYLSGKTGLRADYFNAAATVFSQSSVAVTTAPVLTRTDSTVNFDWNGAAPDPSVNNQNFAVRWSGQVQTEEAGNYVFHVTTDAAVRLWVNGQLVINDYTQHATADDASIAINLQANTKYDIRLDFAQASAANDAVTLEWVRPNSTREIIPNAQLYPFSKPLTINTGGIYVGSWEDTAANSTTVSITTTQPVTIEDSIIRGAGVLVHNTNAGAQITIDNTAGYGLNPNVAGVAKGDFLYAYDAASVDVEHDSINNVGGYGVNITGFVGTGGQTVKILNNQINNLDGRYSDGNGGYENAGQPTPHAIILSQVDNTPGIQIAWNQIINQPGQSYVNDVVNIYDSSGTAASPIQIHDNFIQGLYSPDPDTTYDSGCGIITDGETGADETAYVDIYNNQVVSTGNGGICIAAGHDVLIYNNRVINSGILPDGNGFYASYVGMYIQDYMTGGSSATFYNDGAYNNVAAWMVPAHSNANSSSKAYQNNYVFLQDTPSLTYNNTSLGTPTQAMEAAEFPTWTAKLASSGNTVGLTNAAPTLITPPAPTTPAPAVAAFQVNDGNVQRSMVDSLTVTFSEPVTLAASAITLNLLSPTGGASTPAVFSLNSPDGGTTWVLTFTNPIDVGGSLPDGTYQLTVSAGAVSNSTDQIMAANQTENFWRLFGDFAGTGTITSADYTIFSQLFDSTATPTMWYADANADGLINATDLSAFSTQMGQTMSTITTTAAATNTQLPTPAIATPTVAAASTNVVSNSVSTTGKTITPARHRKHHHA